MMLYEIGRALAATLRGKGVPLPVEYGPERAPAPVSRERIVLERDRSGGDVFSPPKSPGGTNPRRRADRQVGARLRIYAQATRPGSMVHEHERRGDALADQVFVALDTIIRGAHRTVWRVASAKFLDIEEMGLRGLETWPGVVFEIVFSVDRGVFDAAWEADGTLGSGREETTLGAVKSSTKVSLANGADVDEVACGA